MPPCVDREYVGDSLSDPYGGTFSHSMNTCGFFLASELPYALEHRHIL